MPSEFDNFANNYQDEAVSSLGIFGKYRNSSLSYKSEYLKHILPYEPKGILDFGCGIGLNIPYLRKNFPNTKLFGCDISQESIKIAVSKNHFCDFNVITMVENLEYYKNKIDVIFISGVFHHIPYPEHEKWVNGFYELMNSGNHLVIFEHNIKNPMTANIVKNSVIDMDAVMLDPKYCKMLFNTRFFKAGISKNGKGVKTVAVKNNIKLRYTYFFPWRVKLFLTMEYIFYFMPVGAQYCLSVEKL